MESTQTLLEPPPSESRHASDTEVSGFSKAAVCSLFPALICVSLSYGWWVPLFYDWSGTNQGMVPAVVNYAFLGLLVACLVCVAALPLLPRLNRVDPIRNPLIRPFGLRVLGIIAAIVAAGFLAFRDATIVAIAVAPFLYSLVCAIQLARVSPSIRWRIVSLYSCLYFPFVWVFQNDVIQGAVKQGNWSLLPVLTAAPALFPSLYIGQIAGHHSLFTAVSAFAIASLEVFTGLWISQLGARRALAYQIVVLTLSIMSSFGFLGLLRA